MAICQNCGANFSRWQGKCDVCGESFTVPKQGFALVDGGFVTRNYGLEDIKFCARCGVRLGDE